MSTDCNKPYHHGNLKNALVKAAISILDQESIDKVTIRAVARYAGVSHAAPANHFKDRRTLLTHLAIELFSELYSRIMEKLKSEELSGAERLKIFASELVSYGLEYPGRYALLWRRDVVDNNNTDLANAMDKIYDSLLEELESSNIAEGRDIDTVATAIWSLAHGYASLRLDGNYEDRVDQVTGQSRLDAMLDLVFST